MPNAICFEGSAQTTAIAPEHSQGLPADDFHLAQEASRRKQLLSDLKFKVLDVPPSDGENVISLWFETAQGHFGMDLLDINRQPLDSWKGVRRGEQSLVRGLDPGKYVVQLKVTNGARLYGVIGIKALRSCRIDDSLTRGKLVEFRADPTRGYRWPTCSSPRRRHRLALPSFPVQTGYLWCRISRDWLQRTPACSAPPQSASSLRVAISTLSRFAKTLGTPILVPLFSRPELNEIASSVNLQALTRASLEEIPLGLNLDRVDRQLIAMIDAARNELAAALGTEPVKSRVLMA